MLTLMFLGALASAQAPGEVPEKYKGFFFEYSDRHMLEKMLNSVKLTSLPVGRSFALIAGVTNYPNFSPLERSLKPAEVDIEKLKSYLKDQEYFDEIVVLKDRDMNLENLNYFLENYFPRELQRSPHSRFLFAYSGHGYATQEGNYKRGFILTSLAASTTDPVDRIDLTLLRTMLDQVILSAEKVLVLVNSCQSGAFIGRKPFGPNPLGPGDRGAHAILASRANQSSLHLDQVGPGSVFFEKLFVGLDGIADNAPSDGVVTYHEIDTYLHSEIPYVTNNTQTPVEGDISPDGSIGEFFFLNRRLQLKLGNTKPWDPGNAVTFGVAENDTLEKGRSAYAAGQYGEAFQAFETAAAAGNSEAVNYLGLLTDMGFGVAKDYLQEREAFEKAASGGNAVAMYRLGTLYENGKGVDQDYELALQWYQKAASAGNASAMYSLGTLFEIGHGVPEDLQQARRWFERAAVAGNEDAVNHLRALSK
jgi:tetratricopeptide (TPR) repeat protein